MRKVLPLAFAVLLLAAACGEGEEAQVGAGQSGQPPVPETVEETTTVPETTTTTLPQQIVEIPDISDLDLEWDEVGEIDPVTGVVNVYDFNQYLIEATEVNAMVPADDLAELEGEELELALEEALAEAPLKAATLYLGLTPGQDGVQMARSPLGGPEATDVIVIQNVEGDDSVRAIRWEFRIQNQGREGLVVADTETEQAEEGLDGDAAEESAGAQQTEETPEGTEEEVDTEEEVADIKDTVPIVYQLVRTTQCQPGRGHQDFTTGDCV